MTSKSLYFNLFKEDMKRRIWTISLATLVFFLALPIFAMLRLDRRGDLIELNGIAKAQEVFASIAYAGDGGVNLLFIITIVGAVISAISGYFYLYSKSKVDLYHSLPIKREKLYIISYLNGVIIYLVPYIVNIVLYFIIGVAKGLLTPKAVSGAFIALGINLVGYLLLYSITIIAIMLTGNLIVGLLGTGVFMLYGSTILTLKSLMYASFLDTYHEQVDGMVKAKYVSPIFAYNHLSMLVGKESFVAFLCGTIIVAVIFSVAGILLYKKRASESAAKSMAFPTTQVVIKVLITVPIGIVGGLLFMSMSQSNSFGWIIFGTIFIGALSHGIIEIIYNSDFKYIIANKLQLVICVVLSIGIASAVKFDLLGYDTYMPNKNNIESVGISFDELGGGYEYYDFENKNASYYYQRYPSIDYTTYRLNHMKLSNIDNVYEFAKYAADNNITNTMRLENQGEYRYSQVVIRYNLKNNKEAYRSYTVKYDDVKEYMDKIYEEEEYKEGIYQIFDLNKDLIYSVSNFNIEEGIDEALKLTKEQIVEFLNIYENELKKLTAQEIHSEIPVTKLTLKIGEEDNYVTQEYYVYESFAQTIAYMKALGIRVDSQMNAEYVEFITIRDYSATDEYGSEIRAYEPVKEYIYTDKEEIQTVLQAFVPEEYARAVEQSSNMNYLIEVEVKYKYATASSSMGYVLVDKLPEEIKTQLSK